MLSKLDLLLNALRNANLQVRQVNADSYVAQCPSPTHGTDGFDEHPSLSIRVTADNKILIHCFAGCQPTDILAALGLSWSDVAPAVGCRLEDLAAAKGLPLDFLQSIGWRETHKNGVPAVVIPYVNSDGIEVATRFRIALTGDRFRWRTGSKLIPYGLSRLDGYNRERPLWLVEGETDAATLWFIGEQALGVPGKTNIAVLEPVAPTLQNFREVIVWAEPDTEDWGIKIAQILSRPVKVVYATKAGVKDINELWLKCRGSETVFRQSLAALIQNAEEVFPPSARKLTEAPPPLAELLDRIVNFVKRYVILEPHQADAIALWVTHTWLVSATNTTPYLWITSPTKRCGKTRLGEVLACIVNGPRFISSVTPAALFRLVSTQPDSLTLIIDEIDNLFTAKERSADITALLNAGFRRGLTVPRVEKTGKGGFTIQEFSTFCPKLLIGLTRLPDTVADRSITIALQRKKPMDKVADFDWDIAELEAQPIRESLAAWAQDEQFIQMLRTARPEMPIIASDRAKEAWRLLLAIADEAGGDWPQRARQAMVALEKREEEGSNISLLMALKAIFNETGAERLTVAEIAERLVEMDAPPVPDAFLTWQAVGDVRRMGIWLAKMLKPFGIAPVTIRTSSGVSRGYLRQDFEEVWERYGIGTQPPDEPSPSPSPSPEKNGETCSKENATNATTLQPQQILDFSCSIFGNENATNATPDTTATPETTAPPQGDLDAEIKMECPKCGFWKRFPPGDLLLGAPRCPVCGSALQERPEPEPPASPLGTDSPPQAETSETETPLFATPSDNHQDSPNTADNLLEPKTPSTPVPPVASVAFSSEKTLREKAKKNKGCSIVASVAFANTTLPPNFSDPNQPRGELFELTVEPDIEPISEPTDALTDPISSHATAEPTPPEPVEETASPAEGEERYVDTLAFLEAAFGPLVDVTPEPLSYPSPPADQFEQRWETREERIQRLVRQLFKALRNFQRHYSHYHQACLSGNLCQICADFVQKVRKFEQAKDTTELSRLYSANKKWIKGE